MDEPALGFEGVTLSRQQEVVRVFYKQMGDRADKRLIPRIFHEGFSFRGPLGPTLTGYDEFAGHVDWVTGANGDYTTHILVMIEEAYRVGGKMRFHGFHGFHRQELFRRRPDRQARLVDRHADRHVRRCESARSLPAGRHSRG